MAPAPSPPSSDEIASALNVWDFVKEWGTPGVLIAAIGVAWRGGTKYSAIRSELTKNNEDTRALSVRLDHVEKRQDTLGRDHTSLEIAVASLPTRSELQAGFDSVRAEIRDSRCK